MNARATILLLVFLLTGRMQAQWQPDGVPVCDPIKHQFNHVVVTDSLGTIVVWEDYRIDDGDIYAQKIDNDGNRLWDDDAVSVCSVLKPQLKPVAISDGAGGAIIVWEDYRVGSNMTDLYAQRISASGTLLWNSSGVPICTAVGPQMYPVLVGDGDGGAIIAWEDYRSGDATIYAQHISRNGAALWLRDGSPIVSVSGKRYTPVIATDSLGGAIIAWEENRTANEYDIYAQRIDSSGSVLWGNDGLAVCTAPGIQMQLSGYSTKTGTLLLTWQDYRDKSADIYAHILTRNGLAFSGNGTAVCRDTSTQELPRVVPDGIGGMIVTWLDYRSPEGDVFAQRISSNGAVQWKTDGIPICSQDETQGSVDIVPGDSTGAVISWIDYRIARGDVYAQAVENDGTLLWQKNGSPICTNLAIQQRPLLARDGLNGVILTWTEYRNKIAEVYVQRVNRYGTGLPVELLSFSASAFDGDILLRWQTASETNTQGFEVQASVNGVFVTEGFISARFSYGGSYEYRLAPSGDGIYRLRIVDFDGSSEYSPIVVFGATMPEQPSIVSLAPLPANEILTVFYGIPNDDAHRVTVYDLTGRVRMQYEDNQSVAGQIVRTLDVSLLSTGMYILEISTSIGRAAALFPIHR